jgi:signal transduction histidine kinase
MAGFTVKVYRLLGRFVNIILYGGWYDYRSVIEQARRSLTSTDLDRVSVGATLCQVVGQSMRLETVSLVLPDGTVLMQNDKKAITRISMDAEACKTFFVNAREFVGDKDGFVSWKAALNDLIPPVLTNQGYRPHHIVLLRGRNNLSLGILLMGQKRDGDTLNNADFEILKVVIHQAQVTLENARLLEDVQAHAEKISRLHRQVLRAREEERKRLARDLHDLIIQSLVGINYQLAAIRTQGTQGNQTNW